MNNTPRSTVGRTCVVGINNNSPDSRRSFFEPIPSNSP